MSTVPESIDPKKVRRIRAYDEDVEFHDAEDQALLEDREKGETAKQRNHGGLVLRQLISPRAG